LGGCAGNAWDFVPFQFTVNSLAVDLSSNQGRCVISFFHPQFTTGVLSDMQIELRICNFGISTAEIFFSLPGFSPKLINVPISTYLPTYGTVTFPFTSNNTEEKGLDDAASDSFVVAAYFTPTNNTINLPTGLQENYVDGNPVYIFPYFGGSYVLPYYSYEQYGCKAQSIAGTSSNGGSSFSGQISICLGSFQRVSYSYIITVSSQFFTKEFSGSDYLGAVPAFVPICTSATAPEFKALGFLVSPTSNNANLWFQPENNS